MTGSEITASDVKETKNPSLENYKNIKPENKQTTQEVNDFGRVNFKRSQRLLSPKTMHRNIGMTTE